MTPPATPGWTLWRLFAFALLRCLIVTSLLVLSTGPLMRRLMAGAGRELAALVRDFLWLTGLRLVPSLSVLLLVYDAILVVAWWPRSSSTSKTFLRLIVIVFIVLYLADLVMMVTCNHLLLAYRKYFFRLQLAMSVLYLARSWLLTRVDLRELAPKLERFYSLALKVTRALSELLNNTPRTRPPPRVQAVVNGSPPTNVNGSAPMSQRAQV